MRPPRSHAVHCVALLALLLLGGPIASAHASTTEGAGDPARGCAGTLKELDPIELTLTADDASIAAGAAATVHARIHAWGDLQNVRIQLAPEGPVDIAGSRDLFVGTLVRGADYDFEIPVRYAAAGNSAVHVSVRADGEGGAVYARNEGLFTVFRNGRAHADMGGFIYVTLEAIRRDVSLGLLDAGTGARQIEVESAPTAVVDHAPRPVVSPLSAVGGGPEFQQIPLLEDGAGVTPDGDPIRSRHGRGVVSPLSPGITVKGQVSWLDENSVSHPCYGCAVQVFDNSGPTLLAQQATFTDGNYSMVVGGGGSLDLFVRVRAANSVVGVRPLGGGAYYSSDGPLHSGQPDNTTVTDNFTFDNTGTNSCFGILTGAGYVANFAFLLNGGAFLAFVPVEWPGGAGSDFNGSRIRLATGDRWDWDVLHHEYGHYVQQNFNIANNPGGGHSSANCDADDRSSKDVGNRLAWGEGWPTFFGIAGQNLFGLSSLGVPRVGDTQYQDLEDGSLQYNLESQNSFGGEDNERAIMNSFWDLWDGASDGRDQVTESYQTLFDRINAVDPETMSAAWTALRAPLSNADDLKYGGVAADHLIGPDNLTPAAGFLLTPSNYTGTTFSWNPRVGCGTTAPGNSFKLVFYRAGDKVKVVNISGLGSPSHTLNIVEFNTLVTGTTHNYLWAVEGSSTASPATGPYLGENFAITVDSPPVADAGPDQPNVECASHTTTDVLLNGTGSSDPDGDALTYTWSATGVTFNDNHSATPTGHFPEGTTVVTLEVSDGIMTDQDQMTVQVVDTTPPVITCPGNITVECNDHCLGGGVPDSDPAIVAFLAGVSATDVCDATPTLGDNHPACFQLGDNPVTFTAVDDATNQSSCVAHVNVVDTTPPVITVSVDRTSLWPPNHKLATINATVTVTDVCDPSPTFVLTSIVSNEPENGLGDGDTAPDVAGAGYGTDDVQFQLRSERGGTGSGRKYTITYTASDESGNTATATACVFVPHDMAGGALASQGFDLEGDGFGEAEEFAVVVPSIAAETGGEDLLGGDGGVDRNPILRAPMLDATGIDASGVYVGNLAGTVAALKLELGDVNGDGLDDAVLTYPVAAVEALVAISTLDDGPIGLRFELDPLHSYLVPDIFALGAPVSLPAELTLVRRDPGSAHAGSSSEQTAARSGSGAEPAAPAPQLAPTPEVTPEPVVQQALPRLTRFTGVYPNPFAASATVAFDLAQGDQVRLAVYDLRGALVQTLRSAWLPAGRYQVAWDGRDRAGHVVPGGVYLIRLNAAGKVTTRKAVLMK